MIRSFFNFTLLAFVLLAGAHDDERVVILSPDYFPLQEGNYWIYEVSVPGFQGISYSKLEIIGTNQIEGKTYFKAISRVIDGNYLDTLFYRVNDNGYVFRRHRSADESELYHLNAVKGESWHLSDSSMMTFNDFMPVVLTNKVTLSNCRAYF